VLGFQLDDVGVLDVGNLEGVAYLRSRDVYLPRLEPLLGHCGDLFGLQQIDLGGLVFDGGRGGTGVGNQDGVGRAVEEQLAGGGVDARAAQGDDPAGEHAHHEAGEHEPPAPDEDGANILNGEFRALSVHRLPG